MLAKDLETLLKTEIPIAQAIGIRDLQLGEGSLTFTLPLQPNINHKGTLFGGSLYSAGALSCYGLFLLGLRNESVSTNNIVISEGSMRYLAPVNQDARVTALWSSAAERSRFFASLMSRKKARVPMKAVISIQDLICAEFTGEFVAHL